MATQLKITVKPSGGDVTSLFDAITYLQNNYPDLTASGSDRFVDIEIDGDWSSGADSLSVTITGIKTDATHYINIYTTATARHSGKSSTSKYRLYTWMQCITFNAPYVYVTGLQLRSQASNAIYDQTGIHGTLYISKNYIEVDGSTYCIDLFYPNSETIWKIYDNVIVHGTHGIYEDNGGYIHIYNNTFHGQSTAGVRQRFASGFYVKNNLFDNCTADASGTITDSYNATTNDNTKGLTANGANNRFSQTFSFKDAGNHDFTLLTSDSGARDYGTNDPGSGLFSDDIIGVSRSGTWDIGAFEAQLSFIGSAGAYATGSGTTLDCTAAIDIQAGDLLVAWIAWEDGTSTVSIADNSDSSNSFTMLTIKTDDGSDYGCFGYVLSATEKSASTFRMTNGTSRPYRMLSIMQFRPASGDSVTLDTYDDTAYGTNSLDVVSGAITTTSADDILILGALKCYLPGVYTYVPKIGGVDAEGSLKQLSHSIFGYRRFIEQQTSMAFTFTLSPNPTRWISHIISFKSAPSPGGLQELTLSMAGGGLAGGTPSKIVGAVKSFSGGGVSGGSASRSYGALKLVSGGSIAGGAPSIARVLSKQMAGGSLAGGAALNQRGRSVGMVGGGIAAGTAVIAMSGAQLLSMVMSGGAVVGGTALRLIQMAASMAGGSIGGGYASRVMHQGAAMSGGGVVRGNAYVRFTTAGAAGFQPGLYRMIQITDGIVYLAKIGG